MTDVDPVLFKMMAQEAMRQVTASLAEKAREFAKNLPPDATGQMALEAFAAAILSTNAKVFGAEQ